MNIQEQAERDFHPQSDQEIAYAVSTMRQKVSADQPQIDALVDAGRFVLVEERVQYCPMTDASLPNAARSIVRTPEGDAMSFATEAEARTALDAIYGGDGEDDCRDDDSSIRIMRPKGAAVPDVTSWMDMADEGMELPF